MSKGSDGRSASGRDAGGRNEGNPRSGASRTSSRTSVRMTVERARAIQSHADRMETNQDFKARAMAAAQRTDKGR